MKRVLGTAVHYTWTGIDLSIGLLWCVCIFVVPKEVILTELRFWKDGWTKESVGGLKIGGRNSAAESAVYIQ